MISDQMNIIDQDGSKEKVFEKVSDIYYEQVEMENRSRISGLGTRWQHENLTAGSHQGAERISEGPDRWWNLNEFEFAYDLDI